MALKFKNPNLNPSSLTRNDVIDPAIEIARNAKTIDEFRNNWFDYRDQYIGADNDKIEMFNRIGNNDYVRELNQALGSDSRFYYETKTLPTGYEISFKERYFPEDFSRNYGRHWISSSGNYGPASQGKTGASVSPYYTNTRNNKIYSPEEYEELIGEPISNTSKKRKYIKPLGNPIDNRNLFERVFKPRL